MKKMEIGDAQRLLAEYVNDPKQDPVILTLRGKPLAVVLAADGADEETLSLSFNPKFWEIIERSRSRHDREGGISSEELRRRLGLPPYTPKKARSKKGATAKAIGQNSGAAPKESKARPAPRKKLKHG